MRTLLASGLLLVCAAALPAEKLGDEAKVIQNANEVFQEIMKDPDEGIPRDLLQRAECVGIVPSLKKGGFIVGAKYGKGVLLCRGANDTGWVGPSMVKIEGGSFGLQIGAGEVELIFLVMNEEGKEKLLESEFTLGGEAGVMAGPVGRTASAETDAMMHAEILSYSKSKGVFAGVALEGATLRSSDEDNEKLYGKKVAHEDILSGKAGSPADAAMLKKTLSQYSLKEK
jgi:lipid-binding SYLF domain-containing protein